MQSANTEPPKISFYSSPSDYPQVLIPGVELEVVAGSLTESGFKDGKGQAARFHGVFDLASDGKDGFFFLDYNNHALRHLDKASNVTTVLGGEAKIGIGSFESTFIFEPGGLWHSDQLLYLVRPGLFTELNLKTRQSRLLGYAEIDSLSLNPNQLAMVNQVLEKSPERLFFLRMRGYRLIIMAISI